MFLGIALSVVGRLMSSTSIYVVAGKTPELVLDFTESDFRVDGAAETFSNAITHAASSNATMVDSDGLLKWRPHNLLTYSEQFDNAAWTKASSTVAADVIAAPDGTLTADTLVGTSASSQKTVYKISISLSATTYTWTVYAKYLNNQWFAINAYDGANNLSFFDIQNGVVGTVGSGASATITPLSNGWYKCSVTRSIAATANGGIGFNLAPSGSSITFSPIGSDQSVYLWGAHLYRSDLGGMVNNPDRGDSYVPTTSSAVYLPRRGHHVYNGDTWVNKGLLHESEARTNLVTYSSEFDNAAWNKASSTTITANTVVSPDGTQSADTWTTTGTAYPSVFQTVTVASGVAYTTSVFAKAGTLSTLGIEFRGIGTAQDALFDLVNGTVSSGSGLIEYYGNGWYRCSITKTSVDTSELVIIGAGSGGVSAGTIYIYGAQLEAASTPSSYIPTSGATVTRAAETLTVPAANLPWPSPVVISEELVTNGTFDTDSDWTLGTGWTISGGELVATSATGVASQVVSLTGGKVYRITADNTANIQIRIVGGSGQSLGYFSGADVDKIFVFTAGAGSLLEFVANGTTTGIIDNISVKEINPLSVSIQMQGEMTYADDGTVIGADGVSGEVVPYSWTLNSSNYISAQMDTLTSGATGQLNFLQEANGVVDLSLTSSNYYSPSINVPFNIASRHGSTFINGAVDGTALTADTTPVALPDLSATDLQLGYDYMGTISLFRIWADDLGDAGIAEASSLSLLPSMNLTFDGQSTSFTDTGMVV